MMYRVCTGDWIAEVDQICRLPLAIWTIPHERM